ncbi:MAG: apolipoprotein N-acyltransferase [Verrucomicrobiota bacterium]
MNFPRLRATFTVRGFQYRVAAALVSGLLMSMAYPPLDYSWAGWVSLFPLTIAFIWFPPQQRFLVIESLIFGASFFFVTLFWVTEVSVFGWILLSGMMSLYPAIWLNLMVPVFRAACNSLTSLKNLKRAGLGATLWVGLEWVRGWLLTGFPWNYLGVSQWKMVGVIQIAEWGGVLLVSWLVAFISIVLGLTVIRLVEELRRRQKMRPHFEFTLGMLLLGLVILFGIHVIFKKDIVTKEVRVLAVQPDIPQDPWKHTMSLTEVVAKLEVLSISGLSQHSGQIDMVVWPETPAGGEMYSTSEFREALESITMHQQVPLLAGSTIHAGTNLYNSAMLYPGDGGPPQLYYKNHLVLMGETVPLADHVPLIRKWSPLGQNFTAGTAATVLSTNLPNGYSLQIAPLICFEDIFGYMARRYTDTGAEIMVNITNDGWFNQSAQSRQHFANAVFRAIENRMPLLRVANNGITGLIDHKGVIVENGFLGEFDQPSARQAGVFHGIIKVPQQQTTLYQRFGNWVGILGLIGVLIYLPFWWKDSSCVRHEKPLPAKPDSV